MALSIAYDTKLISVPQADLTFVSGTLYTLDSDQFRKDVTDILAAENHIWMPDAFSHNTEVTVAGVTYARTLEFINGYSIQFENTGSAYTVRIEGSNNNIFDVVLMLGPFPEIDQIVATGILHEFKIGCIHLSVTVKTSKSLINSGGIKKDRQTASQRFRKAMFVIMEYI